MTKKRRKYGPGSSHKTVFSRDRNGETLARFMGKVWDEKMSRKPFIRQIVGMWERRQPLTTPSELVGD